MTEIITFKEYEDSRFTVPSTQELEQAWSLESGKPLLKLPDEIYGVCELPDQVPTFVVALDLDEVLRNTGLALAQIAGGTISNTFNETTGQNDYAAEFNNWGEARSKLIKTAMIQELIHSGDVPPVPYSDVIAAFIRQWRASGAYVVADTSTLPGCEYSTFAFLQTHYPDCFQGVLFPRNHDGNGTTTKSDALRAAIVAIERELTTDLSATPIIAIEDMPHHAEIFAGTAQGVQVFVPEYPWNLESEAHQALGISRIRQSLGTVDSFMAAHDHLRERGLTP